MHSLDLFRTHTPKCLSDGDSPVREALSVGCEGVMRAGGRREAPMGGRPCWLQEVCSAGGVACVWAGSERSGWVVPSPGLGPELHAGPWKGPAGAARCEGAAAGSGANAGPPPG